VCLRSHDFNGPRGGLPSFDGCLGFHDFHEPQLHDVIRYDVVGVEFLEQVGQELPEDGRVQVLAQLVHDEPIADLAFLADRDHLIPRHHGQSHGEQHQTDLGNGHDGQAVDGVQQADQRDEHEPRPEERVDFLVDDVQRQHAHAVQRLDGAGRGAREERAPGDSGEHRVRGVGPFLHAGHPKHVGAVRGELAAEHVVDEQHLEHRVGGVHQLAHEEADRVQVVRVHVVGEVLDQHLLALGLVRVRGDRAVQVEHDGPDASGLPRLPQEPRREEQRGLHEQHEERPLAVAAAVVRAAGPAAVQERRVRRVRRPGGERRGGGLRVRPAVRVHGRVVRHPVHGAVDRVAEELARGHHERARDQQHGGHLVVQLEHVVVDAHVVDPHEPFQVVQHDDRSVRENPTDK